MGIIALAVQVIINYDFLLAPSKTKGLPVYDTYRAFLFSIIIYYFIDSFWGLFYSLKIVPIAYTVTVIYFLIMAVCVFCWTRYVIVYLNINTIFLRVLNWSGWFFLIFQIVVLIINLFIPIGFWFDDDGTYHVNYARYLNLGIQTVLFFVTFIYMLIVTFKTSGIMKSRYRAICISSILMTIFVVGQAQHPMLPIYSVGCMLTTCLLHTFVVEDEKEEQHREIEHLKDLEIQQAKALGSAKHMAYTDSLTGVKNKHAYQETEQKYDKLIKDGILKDFGLIVFDLNGLKQINDSKGHEAGDQYIKNACRMICMQFKHSPIYRIGGDEFVAVLEGEDFDNQESLLNNFNQHIEKNNKEGLIVISCGFDKFNSNKDACVKNVFERADKKMYARKRDLKAMVK